MTFTCCVPGCKTAGSKMLHSFPKDKLRSQRWISNTKCFKLNCETAYKTHHKVCKLHFKAEDYTSTMLKFLKNTAVPSLNLPDFELAKKYLGSKNGTNHVLNQFTVAANPSKALFEAEEKFENLEVSDNQIDYLIAGNDSHGRGHGSVVSTESEVQLENLEVAAEPLLSVCYSFQDAGVIECQNQVCVSSSGNNIYTLPSNGFNEHFETVSETPEPFYTDDGGNEVYNEKGYRCAKLFNGQAEFVPKTPEPFLSNDIEVNENFQDIRVNEPEYYGTTASDDIKTSAKKIFVLEDVLVQPAVKNVPNPTSSQETEPKPNLRTKYNPAARRARYQATRIKFLAKKLRDSQKLQKCKILDYLEKKLDENHMTFIRMQVNNAGKKSRGHRFTFEEKCMAFSVFKQSPKCYFWLSKMLTLPCKQTLMKHSALVRFEAGINPTLMTFLSDVVKDMDETDKVVTLGWDEMALKAHLDFCKVKDYIDGFVDDGKETTDEFATHALVFMIRGVHKSYKQPISYFLTQNINKTELAELIKLVTEAVMDVGLKVVGSVCDAVVTNMAAVKVLMQPQSSKLPDFCLKYLEYRIRNAAIIHFFDPPHLIKTIRNNMLTKDLYHYVALKKSFGKASEQINWDNRNKVERIASWDDVSEFYYEYDRKGINQLLEKITDEHIEPKKKKMKVSVAVQVFSRTFGTTMRFCSEKKQLPRDFTGTADILVFFNEVFDSLNGGGLPSVKNSLMGSVHRQSYHFTFWKYAVEMLKKMRFVPKVPEKQERSRVLKDYELTINGLAELAKRLFEINIENVSIKMMTQDALENFFGGIRSYCRAAVCPTPRNFRCAYATSVFNNLTSRHSIKSNCEEDGGAPLIRNLFSKFMTAKRSTDVGVEENETELDDDSTSNVNRKLSTAESEAGNVFAAQVCKTIFKQNKCLDCEKTITSRGKNEAYHGLINARSQNSAAGNQLIIYPKPKFIDNFKKLTSDFERLIPFQCYQKSLRKVLLRAEETTECFAGCNLHKNEFTQKVMELSSETLIFAFINKINNLLSGKVEVLSDPHDHIQKAAFDFRLKKKHIGKYSAE